MVVVMDIKSVRDLVEFRKNIEGLPLFGPDNMHALIYRYCCSIQLWKPILHYSCP